MSTMFSNASYVTKYSFITILLLFISEMNAQKTPNLKFDQDGKFKIMQFTDVHLKVQNKPRCDSVMNTITIVLAKEKPDMVILTGDIATSEDVKLAWSTVTKPMRDAGIPWAVVFGNHDHEHGFTNKQMMDYLVTLPLNLSENGPVNIFGSGNYILEIHGSKSNKTKALLYCFDSNAYTGEKDNPELGDYDWIKNDQIQWYRKKSIEYTKKNMGKPLPALAFFHIPLPEYNLVRSFSNTIGDKDEEVASPVINSGMYNAMYESKDVVSVFCGHDHNNNFIGTLNNIGLAYGCKTGKDAYGRLDKGGRVIVLYEGERKFDTWLTTINESGKYFVTYPDSFKK
jgi:predicted MPP superfamily phosphohydrolase